MLHLRSISLFVYLESLAIFLQSVSAVESHVHGGRWRAGSLCSRIGVDSSGNIGLSRACYILTSIFVLEALRATVRSHSLYTSGIKLIHSAALLSPTHLPDLRQLGATSAIYQFQQAINLESCLHQGKSRHLKRHQIPIQRKISTILTASLFRKTRLGSITDFISTTQMFYRSSDLGRQGSL